MPIFYENFLKKTIPTNAYFEEEVNITDLTFKSLEDIPDQNTPLKNIDKNVVFSQGVGYFLIRINDLVFSFSFIAGKSDLGIKNSKALTFGLIKNEYLDKPVKNFKGLTKMASYRDSVSSPFVSDSSKEILWRSMLGAFKHAMSGSRLIYRSTLEASEFYILSNLYDYIKDDANIFFKKEITDKIQTMINNIDTSMNKASYASISTKNYKPENPSLWAIDNPSKLNKKVNKRTGETVKSYLFELKKEIEETQDDKITKELLAEILEKLEPKSFLRTKGYTDIINKIFGADKVKEIFKSDMKDINAYLKRIKDKIEEQASFIVKEGNNKTKRNVFIPEKEIESFLKKVKEVLEDENNVNKELTISNLFDDFYISKIQNINYLTNKRYMVLNI
jgi:hypothetical protein